MDYSLSLMSYYKLQCTKVLILILMDYSLRVMFISGAITLMS